MLPKYRFPQPKSIVCRHNNGKKDCKTRQNAIKKAMFYILKHGLHNP